MCQIGYFLGSCGTKEKKLIFDLEISMSKMHCDNSQVYDLISFHDR